MELWLTNPLEDVFRTDKKPNLGYYNRIPDPEIHMARNARESLQLAVCCEEIPMSDVTLEIEQTSGKTPNGVSFDVGGVRYIHNSSNSVNIGSKVIRAKLPGELPQCIDPRPAFIEYRQTRSFFITANTEKNALPGEYTYKIHIKYGVGRLKKPETAEYDFKVTVYDVCLPDPEKSEYNHVTWLNACGYSPERDYESMVECNAKTYGIETFSDDWFRLLENYAAQLRRERINIVTVPLYPLLQRDVSFGEHGEYIFDFTLLDRYLDTFLSHGSVKYFCGFHLMAKVGVMLGENPEETPHPIACAVFDKEHTYKDFKWLYMNDENAWRHLEMLISGLYAHLKARGLENRWLQHVADEVAGEEAFDAIKRAYRLVHKLAPEFKTIDATWEDSLEKYGELLNIHVPQIDIHDKNEEAYAAAHNMDNIDVWTYTCLKPQFNYLSRLDDWKLIGTRLIHWYNFKNGLNGYLHWSWNLWFYGDPWRDGCTAGWPLDGWVVFPDTENLNVFESIRQRENASGIEDLELLKICDKKDHEKTMSLVSAIIERANDYTTDSGVFFRVRRQLLELASGAAK